MSNASVIWVVTAPAQGPVQAFRDVEKAKELAAKLGGGVYSCALVD